MVGHDRSNIKKIFSNIVWMLFDKVFVIILNLIITIRIANYYGSLEYGTYQYAVSIVAIFELLVTFVDGRVVKKKYSVYNPKDIVLSATVARAFFSLIAFLMGFFYIIFNSETTEYNIIFIILLFNAIVINLRFGMQNRYEYLLKSRKTIVANNAALTIGGVLQLIAISLKLELFIIAIITLLSSAICLVITFVQYTVDFGLIFNTYFNWNIVKALIKESLPLAIAASCAIVYSRCDSVMVGSMLSKNEVGIYAIAVKLVNIVDIAIAPIRDSVYPKMIELYFNDRKQYEIRYIQITSIFTWIYIIGVLISFVILPFAFKALKPEYAQAFPIYQVYVLGMFFSYNGGLRAGHYTLIGKGKFLMYAQMSSVLFNIVLNYFLIKQIGVFGAAISTVVTQAMAVFVSNIFFGFAGWEVFRWQIKGLNPARVFGVEINKKENHLELKGGKANE